MYTCRKLSKYFTRFTFQSLNKNSRTIVHSIYPDITLKRETIAETVFPFCDEFSNNIAYIDDVRNISYTFSDLKRSISSIASALTKKGVKPGLMVAIIASNSPEYLMLTMAISSMGCTVTTCNQNYTESEMKYQLTDCMPSILFTDSQHREKVAHVASEIPTIKHIYLIGDRMPGYDAVDDLLNDSGNMSPIGSGTLDLYKHVAVIPYSSGTSGIPKGVMLTHENLTAELQQIRNGFVINKSKVKLLVLPLYHIYGIMAISMMTIYSGSTLVIQPKFEPLKFLSGIEKYKVNTIHLVPPLVLFLLNHPEVSNYDLTSLEYCICGAAPLDSFTEKRFIDKFRVSQPEFEIYQGYGLSETTSMTHVVPNGKRISGKSGSIGLLAPNMQCKVVDYLTRKELPAHQPGEVLLRGPNVMKGYFNKAEETEKVFENDWFKTGDIGHYDDDQYFYISDRCKELIKVKGYQVAPAELEAILLTCPGVCDCAVVGVPDDKHGEVPKAFIVANKEIRENEIHDFMNKHLSAYKQLRGGIVFTNEIPKSPSGKILRRLLK